MSLIADTKAFLAGRAAIAAVVGNRVSYNRVPMGYDGPFLWFAQRTIDRAEDVLDEPAGSRPYRVSFDVEAVSLDGDDCTTLASALNELSNYRGAFGNSSTVQAIFLSDQSDEYVPRGKAADEELEVVALQLEIVGYVPAA
jgi:hypothetical protein